VRGRGQGEEEITAFRLFGKYLELIQKKMLLILVGKSFGKGER